MFAGCQPAKIFNGSVISTYKAGPLNGKHKINTLCALCGSAVKKVFNFNKKCLNIYCRISNIVTQNLISPLQGLIRLFQWICYLFPADPERVFEANR